MYDEGGFKVRQKLHEIVFGYKQWTEIEGGIADLSINYCGDYQNVELHRLITINDWIIEFEYHATRKKELLFPAAIRPPTS